MSSNSLNSIAKKPANKTDLPFYEQPMGVVTASQIIKEAREKLHDTKQRHKIKNNSSSNLLIGAVSSSNISHQQQQQHQQHQQQDTQVNLIRTLSSNRPFTPREEKRTLFGPKSTRPVNERPPSSFYIGSKSFTDTDNASSRPLSATRLSPIDKPLSASSKLTSQGSFDETKPNHLVVVESSPKISKSRLAPLEIPSEKLKSIKIKEFEFKEQDLAPTTSKQAQLKNDSSSSSASDQNEINWKSSIEPLLNMMNDYFKVNAIEQFCEACDRLNKQLETHQMYSKTCTKRAILLKTVFKYLDTDSDKIKIKTSKVILNMKVSSNNLTNICRLLFSISRNTDNDVYFMDNEMLDSLLNSSKRLDFKENSDSVVYFCGTMKNLSENQRLLKQLSSKNVEEIFSKIIKDLSKYYNCNKETQKQEAGHALVQLTATLRNLADLSNTRHKFLNLNLIDELTTVLKYYTSDNELMLNVSRILSKLSLHADCCNKLANSNSCYKSFIKIMLKHETKQDLIVRIGFILGNLTSRHDNARVLFLKEKYSLDTLVKTLKVYFDLDQTSNNRVNLSVEDLNENEPSPNEDVMIKLIRVIANLAINEDAGLIIANRIDLFDILLKILETKDLTSEELIINTIVTINNLSFYDSQLIVEISKNLIDCLMKYLLSNNNDVILETFRVFANLSRHQSIRNYLINKKVNILAIAYLNSNNRELIYIVIGVLINIMSDSENRYMLKEEKGVKKLIEILIEISSTDWLISSMVCKLLMNYSEKPKNSSSSSLSNFEKFEKNELILLQAILIDLLDEKFAIDEEQKLDDTEEANENLNGNINEYINYLWTEEFSPVANLLLKRVTEDLKSC